MLKDFINNKNIIVVGTGVGQKSSDDGFYYANHNSNCFWSVASRLNWIDRIPQNKEQFDSIMFASNFGFTDLVKDYSGNDNKVLQKYFRPVNGKIKIDNKYLINKSILDKDKKELINRIKMAQSIILNGKPITKLIFGTDKFEYGLIKNIDLLESVGLNNCQVLFARNTVIRNNNDRIKIENKLIELYSMIRM